MYAMVDTSTWNLLIVRMNQTLLLLLLLPLFSVVVHVPTIIVSRRLVNDWLVSLEIIFVIVLLWFILILF